MKRYNNFKKFGPRINPVRRRIRLLGRGLRLAGQKGGCKMRGRGLTVAGQHGGMNVRQLFNHVIANPAKRWYGAHKHELNQGLKKVSNFAGQVLPIAMLATL